MRFLCTAAIAVVSLHLAIREASADPNPTDVAAAQSLFDQGRKLIAAGKYAEACPKLEESQKLDPAQGTLFHLADCWEHVGRTASAWATFLDVASSAKATGRSDREQISRSRAAALEKRLSRLTIVAPNEAASGLEIKRDGAVVRPGLWSTPIPVDLGTHTVSASAPGKQTWEGKVEVSAEGANLSITIPTLRDAPVASNGTTTPTAPATFLSQKNVGLMVGGVGVVALAVSIPLGLAAKSKYDDAKRHCDASGCDDIGVSLDAEARRQGNTATVVSLVGVAAAATGAVLWLTAGPKAGNAPQVGLTPSGVQLRGTW
jgi:hypothetical protein